MTKIFEGLHNFVQPSKINYIQDNILWKDDQRLTWRVGGLHDTEGSRSVH